MIQTKNGPRSARAPGTAACSDVETGAGGAQVQSENSPCLKVGLQHLVHGEIFDLEVVLRTVQQGLHGDDTHHLTADHPHAIAPCLHFYHLKGGVDRRSGVIGQVHGDLGLIPILQGNAQRLHEVQAAADVADPQGDLPGDLRVWRVQIDVETDQGHPGADGGGASGGVDGIRAEVRLPHGVLHFLPQPLELPLSNVGQIHPVGGGGRFFIQVEGLPIPLRRQPGHLPGQPVRILNGAVPDRNKRDHIHTADAGVLPLMAVHVDQLHRAAHRLHHGLLQGLRLTQDRDNAAVVVRVDGVVQQLDPGPGPKCVHNLLDLFQVPPLAEIWDGLDPYFFLHVAVPLSGMPPPAGCAAFCLL